MSLSSVDEPVAHKDEVLIEVVAAGVNRADVMQRKGYYSLPPGDLPIPGLEVSGMVVGVGRGSSSKAEDLLGREVVALLPSGGYAEKVVAHVDHVLPVPSGISVVDSAGLITVAATAHSNLRMEAGVRPDDTVLIHGGTGGVGSFSLQYLRAIGAKAITTVGDADKVSTATKLGAEHVINYRLEDFTSRVLEITHSRGVDVILDVVGAKYLNANLSALAKDGQLFVIGLQGGHRAEVDLSLMLKRRLRISATSMGSRNVEDKAAIVSALHTHVWPLIEAGALAVQTDRIFSLAEVSQAHEYFDTGGHVGKVLLVP